MTAALITLADLAANPAGIEFSVDLGGDAFRLDIRYNDRDERYYLSVYDEDDVPVALSVKMVLDLPLLLRFTGTTRPKGELMLVDKGGGQPTLGVLGDGVDLVFVPWSDFA